MSELQRISSIPPARAVADVETALVVELAEALHRCGAPAHRLEGATHRVCAALELDAQVFATPTMILIALGGETRLRRVSPGDVELERMVAVDQIATWTARGVLTAEEALLSLREAMAAPPRYKSADIICGFGVLSASAAVFFGGGWLDVLVSMGLGLSVGQALRLLGRRPETARLAPLAASFGAAWVAGTAASVVPVDHHILTLAALIVLLPGFSLTTAMSELSTGNLSAGSARLSGVAVTFLLLAVGASAGWAVSPPPLDRLPSDLPLLAEPLALIAAGLSLGVLFQARPRDTGIILLSSATAYYGARAGIALLGPLGGAFAGALMVTALSNIQARLRDVPASIALIPGILLLVPGTVGFRGIGALLEQRTLDGLSGATSALLIATALVAGILSANALISARREL
jgi:uncharacterized membrane protein YjjP (DUF1212 family)